jgi:hypothetical protein
VRIAAFPRFAAGGAASHPIVRAGTAGWDKRPLNLKGSAEYYERALQIGREEEARGHGGFELVAWALANGHEHPQHTDRLPTSLALPDGVAAIVPGAFALQHTLTSIRLPATLRRIGADAFRLCTGLKELTLPAQLPRIERAAFSGCKGLTALALPAALTRIDEHAFRDCTGLTRVALPAGLAHIGKFAFLGCTGLTGPLALPPRLAHLDLGAFEGCTGLTEVSLPGALTHLHKFAFYGCTLTALHLPLSLGVAKLALELDPPPPRITVGGRPCPREDVLTRIGSALQG